MVTPATVELLLKPPDDVKTDPVTPFGPVPAWLENDEDDQLEVVHEPQGHVPAALSPAADEALTS